MATANEALGPAERIIQSLLTHQDHMVHNRVGVVQPDPHSVTGLRWAFVTTRVKDGEKGVYRLDKIGKKTVETRLGALRDDRKVVDGGRVVGEYREAGIYPEMAVWLYRQVAEVWKLDNEFAARWASYAFVQEHRDLKVVLAAFMLVQSRKGDPVLDGGKVAFHDEDYRDVGEAMMLIHRKDDRSLNPRLLLRIHDVLRLEGVAAINRELGFGKSARRPFEGRWPQAVTKWLQYREENPKVLDGLVKAGFRSTVMELAERVRYKPTSPKFFETLRWKQVQAKDGRRSMLIGADVKEAESWEGLTEAQICEAITKDKPNWKRIIGLLPKKVGVTRAIMAAAVEAGCLSGKDLIILTPTLEELGLLEVKAVKVRWDKAIKDADDMRATNIARNVKSKEVKEQLQEASDNAVKAAVEEVTRNMRVYFLVDISGSMSRSIDQAKQHIAKFLQGFPLDRVHVATFNQVGRVVEIKHASAAGVENAFRGFAASGGTSHGQGVRALSGFKPKDDEDTIFIWVGDEGEQSTCEIEIRASGLRPQAFGFVKLPGDPGRAVTGTAAALGIPCFMIDSKTFEDPYAIPRTIRNLVAATPVGPLRANAPVVQRLTLVDQILKTELLAKPAWAA